MKKISFIWFLLFLCFFGANGQNNSITQNQTDSWKEFTSKEAGFKILFPEAPKYSSEVIMSTPIKRTNHRFEVSLARGYFAVHFSDHPLLPNFDDKGLKVDYDFLKKNTAKITGAEIIKEKEVYLGSNLGYEVLYKLKDEAIIDRFFSIDKRLYQIIVSISYSDLENAQMKKDLNRFYNSFELTNLESKKTDSK